MQGVLQSSSHFVVGEVTEAEESGNDAQGTAALRLFDGIFPFSVPLLTPHGSSN